MARGFIDTNVLVYANDVDDPRRQNVAITLLDRMARNGEGVLSTQVLTEYASVALRKMQQAPTVVEEQVDYYASTMEVIAATPSLIRRAVSLTAQPGISFYDALIIVAAAQAGCAVLYSEDLSAGQSYSGVRVTNPFAP